eukprot:SAG31_NODE_1468_length_8223_cov_37.850320_6_plen_197_part_00
MNSLHGCGRRGHVGAKYIYKYAGKVATEEFLKNHPVTIIRQTLPNGGADNLMGTVDLGVLPAAAMEPNAGFDEKPKAAVNSEADPVDEIPPLPACLNANDFEGVMPLRFVLLFSPPALCLLCSAFCERGRELALSEGPTKRQPFAAKTAAGWAVLQRSRGNSCHCWTKRAAWTTTSPAVMTSALCARTPTSTRESG